MPDFSEHKTALKLLEQAQDADKENRDLAKEDHLFVTLEDGQWEDHVSAIADDNEKPKYTFDMTSPIIDQIAGAIEKADFDINIKPTGGEATKEKAQFIDGLVRNIETISNASTIYSQAGRNVATAGIDGWMLVAEEVDDMSFEQDILVKAIHNFDRRVWFDTGAQRQDKADSDWGHLLSQLPTNEYNETFPDGSGLSVSNGDTTTSDICRDDDTITIGHLYYRKLTKRTLVQTKFGRVFIADDDLKKVEDDLARMGDPIEKRRDIMDSRFMMRKYDGGKWLGEEEETPFSNIPLVVCYGNFKVIEGQIQYQGAVRKLKDPQRILNYSLSREIEEGALAPRSKIFMTEIQAAGHEDTLATLNTNMDAVQYYNHDPEEAVPPPFVIGGAAINPGLRIISDGMQNIMSGISGIFEAGMGDNPNAQSGVAIEKLQSKGNNITSKYFTSLEISICYTAKLIVDAIPIVYDTNRQVRIMNEDGTFKMETIKEVVLDEETGEEVTLNDLSDGKYDVTCKAGPSFDSRQSETVAAITELAQIAPETASLGLDVLLKNVSSPGTDKIADRARQQLLNQGLIPQDQLTPEEQQQLAEAEAQPKEPTGDELLGQAEIMKAENGLKQIQLNTQKADNELQVKIAQLQQAQNKLDLQGQEQALTAREKEFKLGLDAAEQAHKETMDFANLNRELTNDEIKNQNITADTFKKIREGLGARVEVVTPAGLGAHANQAGMIIDGQRGT